MTIQTRFIISWQEYYAAWRFLKRHGAGIAPEKLTGIILTLTGIMIWMFGGHALFAVVGILTGLTAVISVPLLYRLGLRHRWVREPLHKSEHTIIFSEEGIHYLQGPVDSHLNWGFYERMMESDEGFLLICGEDVFSFIPRRAFASEQAIRDFRALAVPKFSRR